MLMIDGFAGDNCDYDITTTGVLPVNWVSANANLIQHPDSRHNVELAWVVNDQHNVSEYVVERGEYVIGKENNQAMRFEPIGSLEPSPDRAINGYTYRHTESHSGTNYYRIRNVDHDGRSSTSMVMAV